MDFVRGYKIVDQPGQDQNDLANSPEDDYSPDIPPLPLNRPENNETRSNAHPCRNRSGALVVIPDQLFTDLKSKQDQLVANIP